MVARDNTNVASAKQLSARLGVRTVDIIKILIKLEIAPNSSDEMLLPEVVDMVLVQSILWLCGTVLTLNSWSTREFQIELKKIKIFTQPLRHHLTTTIRLVRPLLQS